MAARRNFQGAGDKKKRPRQSRTEKLNRGRNSHIYDFGWVPTVP